MPRVDDEEARYERHCGHGGGHCGGVGLWLRLGRAVEEGHVDARAPRWRAYICLGMRHAPRVCLESLRLLLLPLLLLLRLR